MKGTSPETFWGKIFKETLLVSHRESSTLLQLENITGNFFKIMLIPQKNRLSRLLDIELSFY